MIDRERHVVVGAVNETAKFLGLPFWLYFSAIFLIMISVMATHSYAVSIGIGIAFGIAANKIFGFEPQIGLILWSNYVVVIAIKAWSFAPKSNVIQWAHYIIYDCQDDSSLFRNKTWICPAPVEPPQGIFGR